MGATHKKAKKKHDIVHLLQTDCNSSFLAKEEKNLMAALFVFLCFMVLQLHMCSSDMKNNAKLFVVE